MDVIRLEQKLAMTELELRTERRIHSVEKSHLEKLVFSLQEEVHLLHSHLGDALLTNQKAMDTATALVDKVAGDQVQGDQYVVKKTEGSQVLFGRSGQIS